MTRAHVVGAGLAGLAAAVRLSEKGIPVSLYEGAGQAGGRCRSFFDETLGRRIDNGNHLLLSGNHLARAYLATIGAEESLAGPDEARFPFVDLATNERWEVRPGPGPVPLWLLDARRRVPGTKLADYVAALGILFATPETTVEGCFAGQPALYRRFWEPLAVAVLNTPPDRASARALLPVLLRTFARGEAACRPRIAREGLSESFVDPALNFLAVHNAEIRFGERLIGLEQNRPRVSALRFSRGTVRLGRDDVVVLALPPIGAEAAVEGLAVPSESAAIVNVHFRLETPETAPQEPRLVGLVGGTAQWLFLRGDMASVTVSAADGLVQETQTTIAEQTWRDVARALGQDGPLPPHRVVKERRATILQDAATQRLRPPAATALANLWLAGDWTRTGLPATIEGAIQSGFHAALLAAHSVGRNGRNAPVPGDEPATTARSETTQGRMAS